MDSLSMRDLTAASIAEMDTKTLLEHANHQAIQRRYEDFLIVDVDGHHYENMSYAEIFEYIDDPVMRDQAKYQGYGRGGISTAASGGGYQNLMGRVTRNPRESKEQVPAEHASRHHADQALDGCDGHRHRDALPDADAHLEPDAEA